MTDARLANYFDKANDRRWRVTSAHNGKVISTSSEGYRRSDDYEHSKLLTLEALLDDLGDDALELVTTWLDGMDLYAADLDTGLALKPGDGSARRDRIRRDRIRGVDVPAWRELVASDYAPSDTAPPPAEVLDIADHVVIWRPIDDNDQVTAIGIMGEHSVSVFATRASADQWITDHRVDLVDAVRDRADPDWARTAAALAAGGPAGPSAGGPPGEGRNSSPGPAH